MARRMHLSVTISSLLQFRWLLIIILVVSPGGSAENVTIVDDAPVRCDAPNPSWGMNSQLRDDLHGLWTSLAMASLSSPFGNISYPGHTSTMFGFFQCLLQDLASGNCSACIAQIVEDLENSVICPNATRGSIQTVECYLRYDDNQSFLQTVERGETGHVCNPGHDLDLTFISSTSEALEAVFKAAPNNTAGAPQAEGELLLAAFLKGGVYAYAQCLVYLSPEGCAQCLQNISSLYIRPEECSVGVLGARVFAGSCYYRFETSPFWKFPVNTLAPPPANQITQPDQNITQGSSNTTSNTTSRTKAFIAGGTVGAICLLSLLAIILYLVMAKRKKLRAKGLREEQADIAAMFSLNELKEATGNFHPDNKLGEGGYGSVYKGTLRDGRDAAIKKLTSGSNEQGKSAFMTEVNLLTSLHHKNLIRLLGCCVEETERLLVFEYLPKQSLEKCLFDDGGVMLDWPARREIIMGTARGLVYLHHDSHVRIIHRGIKPSNILLDDNFHPKLADFGLAKLFSADQTHTITRITGTQGYLAPEYLMQGQLTEKADVYSFGLVTLEIVSGRRNTDHGKPTESRRLLEWTWRLYQEQRQLEIMDPKLSQSECSLEEVTRVVHIALLCTQASAGLRPTMSQVLLMLSQPETSNLEIPTKPAFVVVADSEETNGGPTKSATSKGTYTPNFSNATASTTYIEPR